MQAWIEAPPGSDAADAAAAGSGRPRLSAMQWRLWSLATAGKLFEGLVVFLGGLALPLVAAQFQLGPGGQGLVSAATLAGILVGALLLGGLADRYGRRPVFIGEMLLLALALLAAGLSPSAGGLVAALFVVGLALGADYPTAHLVISESIPAAIRGRLVLAAFSFQALGALLGTALAALLLDRGADLSSWRLFYLLPVPPVLLVAWGRLPLPESSQWLLSRGRHRQAQQQLQRLLRCDELELELELEPVPPQESEREPMALRQRQSEPELRLQGRSAAADDWRLLFRDPLQRATILASLPWFLQDLATYGIGLFTPLILAASYGEAAEPAAAAAAPAAGGAAPLAAAMACASVAGDPGPAAAATATLGAAACELANTAGPAVAALIRSERMAAHGTLLVDGGLLLGIACAIALADRCGRIPLQILGFLGSALGLAIALLASSGPESRLALLLFGFLLFTFMTNLGPNAQTYLLAGELFPLPLRGLGAGLAAAAGKLGAVLTALLFPVLLNTWGMQRLLLVLVFSSLLGAWITWRFRIETAGSPLGPSGL